MSATTVFMSSVYQQFDSGSGVAGSEVVAFEDGLLFVTNGAEERIDIFDAATGVKQGEADASSIDHFAGINSVAVFNGLIAVAVTRSTTESGITTLERGAVAFFNTSGQLLANLTVGYGPDMLTFSAEGTKLLVANEGEPSSNGENNPGSVSVIDLSAGVLNAQHTEVSFTAFDGQEESLRALGVRIFPDAKASEDFEPEYISIAPDGQTAFITLQEANTVATLDLNTLSITHLLPLGTTDHSAEGYGLDASDRDNGIHISTWSVQGLHMPDTIASYAVGEETYFVIANEGDDRGEPVRVKDLVLDPTAFPNAAALQASSALGRLNVSSIDGDTDGDGDYDVLYAYGSRSFSIFNDSGELVFDSGDDFEQIIAQLHPERFNADGSTLDGRSDNKGPEPEALAIGRLGEHTYAFIGLERDSGIMVYDITDPSNGQYVTYLDSVAQGNVSPEVIKFISASDSVTGKPQLAIAYEGSGTTALIDIDQIGDNQGRTVFGADTHAAYVERLYQGLLERDSDAEGMGYWLHRMEQGSSQAQIAHEFLAFAEGFEGLGNEAFVSQLYEQMLGRAAEATELGGWSVALNAGETRAEVVAVVSGSAEAVVGFVTEGMLGVNYDLWVA